MSDDRDPAGPGAAPQKARDVFFIGWALPARPLALFLAWVAVTVLAAFATASLLIAATQSDPGDGAFRGDFRRQTLVGVLTTEPYPMVTLTEASERYPQGHSLLLSGGGKRGVADRATDLDGVLVQVSGTALKRGTVDMLQLRGGRNGLQSMADMGPAPDPLPVEDLGRWRLTGEICDGKCYTGAMRPGTGLAHKACANFCLLGGVPPIFVTTVPIDGEEFLMIGDADGGPITDRLLDHTATLVAIEGRVERRGEMLVFLIDPDSIRLAR